MRIDQGHQFASLRTPDIFADDAALRLILFRQLNQALSQECVAGTLADLATFSHRCCTTYKASADKLQGHEDEPRLKQFDAWGRRVDELVTGQGWKDLKQAAAVEGLPSIAYGASKERLGDRARTVAFTRVLLFGPFSKLVLCPVSMTDGAARVLELHGTAEQKEDVLLRLLSVDPKAAWTAGQWMTERPGGSDISQTETTARPLDLRPDHSPQSGDVFVLDGFKWFSSATDGDVALALARTGALAQGSSGLSLFLIRLRDEATGRLNGVRVHRLKQKMGTRYLPTAELELDGCRGELIGPVGHGVKTISSVLNITRLYSAAGAVCGLSYGLRLSSAYAQSRLVGKYHLSDLPLHTHSLFRVTVLQRALVHVFYTTVSLLGKSECGTASATEELLLRLYTPALKAFASSRAPEACLSLIDSFGGQGYMEDSGLGVAEMLRDLTVERIWEGTAEVLSLDVVRVITKSKGEALRVFLRNIDTQMAALKPESLKALGLDEDLASIRVTAVQLGKCSHMLLEAAPEVHAHDFRFARPLLELIVSLTAAVLLIEHAVWIAEQGEDAAQRAHIASVCSIELSDPSLVASEVHLAKAWIQDVGDIQRSLSRCARLVEERRQKQSRDAAIETHIVHTPASRDLSKL
ncbi:unnamed protein product [Parajaminaea phylloscopi]